MGKVIYLTPGHGIGVTGKPDPGAVGPTGLKESEVTQNLAGRTGHLLRAKGHQADATVESYTQAVKRANTLNADLFVSIHCNAAVDRSANGFEVLYASAAGERVAAAIAREMVRQISGGASAWLDAPVPLRNRGIKKRSDLYVLKATRMPAVLVEVAFISNPREEQLLRDRFFLQAVAQAIADGVNAAI